MLTHYEHTIDQKDQTEKNLNKALDLLCNKTIAYRRYYEWRIIHIERRRQQYSLMLAKRFYEDKMKRVNIIYKLNFFLIFLLQKSLANWKNFLEREWKKRFELACEKKAKDVLIELGNEYELKYKQLELQLLNANEEIARLRIDNGEQDEALKKAFMRGVCALNMEAMSVLLKNENDLETINSDEQQQRRCCHRKQSYFCKTYIFIFFLLDYDSSDEGILTTGDEDNGSKSSSDQQRFSTHVYKEYLPSTIYRTGEARSIRVCFQFHRRNKKTNKLQIIFFFVQNTNANNNQNRHVTFQKRQLIGTNRSRHSNNNVLVERHAPTNNIRS